MSKDEPPLEPGERHLLFAGLAVVGCAAVVGLVVGALLGGTGAGGMLLGAGIGIVVSVAIFAREVVRRL